MEDESFGGIIIGWKTDVIGENLHEGYLPMTYPT
jgi:hypothetical protein